MSQESRHYWLTYPTKRVTRPVIGEMKKKFALTTRIRSATITEEFGQIALELSGEQKVIGAALCEAREHVGRCGRDHEQITALRQRYVKLARQVVREHGGVRRAPREARKGGGADEPRAALREHDFQLRSLLLQCAE